MSLLFTVNAKVNGFVMSAILARKIMIISEKQIMQLIGAARHIIQGDINSSAYKAFLLDLLIDIESQQSEELKVIE